MEPIALIKALRESTRPLSDEIEIPFWLKQIRPLLPAEPLSDAFLDEVMEPVQPGILRIFILDLLSRLKRKEIANYAARMAGEVKEFELRAVLARILMHSGDARGYALTEELYGEASRETDSARRDLMQLELARAMEHFGPGDARAREIINRCGQPLRDERMLKHSKHAHRVGQFVFEVALSGDDVVCRAADTHGYDRLAMAYWLMWLDPGKFITVLENRSKWKRGPNSLIFAEAGRGKIPDGKVQASYAGENRLYDRALVEESACVFAQTAIDLLKEAGRPVPDGIAERLKALRARI